MNHRFFIARFSLFTFFVLLLSGITVNAAGFELLKIGQLGTNNARYTEWWYTVENPALQGTAAQSSTVTIKVDDKTFTVDSDSSGAWTFYPTTMAIGDHKIDLSNSAGSYAFTLHVGQDLPANLGSVVKETTPSTGGTTGTPSVPVTGSNQLAGVLFTLVLFSLGWYLYNKKVTKDFEHKVTRDL